MFRYSEFPVQDQPVYDFYLSDDGHIHIRTYDRYTVTDKAHRDGPLYRIHTGYTGIVLKRGSKFDRFLNGHYFTMKKDRNPVIEAIQAHYDAKIAAANETISRSCAALRILAGAKTLADIEDVRSVPGK